MDTATLAWLSFLAGIYAAVGSPCAIVLYPGYLAFLARRTGGSRRLPWPLIFGIAVAAGVITGILAGGILFFLVLFLVGEEGRRVLTAAIFCILLLLSLLLILDIDLRSPAFPFRLPGAERPFFAAYFLGLVFGLIVLPCNAAPVIALLLLASAAPLPDGGLWAFVAFGLGMVLPLLLLAALSQAKSRQILTFLTANSRGIRILAGVVMLLLSAWYLALLLFPGISL